jgi:hypothetical protein
MSIIPPARTGLDFKITQRRNAAPPMAAEIAAARLDGKTFFLIRNK